jgi:hypothetical protein
MNVQEAQNDKDRRSMSGVSVGVGTIFGVTFPLVGVSFRETKMKFTENNKKQDQDIST